MEFTEIEGERKGSKVLVTEDKHLYRYAKPNTPYLICYLGEITKTMQKTSPHIAKCPATATLKEGKINLRKEHNHEPDLRIHDRLSARKKHGMVLQIPLSRLDKHLMRHFAMKVEQNLLAGETSTEPA